jgi:hypothetical protein
LGCVQGVLGFPQTYTVCSSIRRRESGRRDLQVPSSPFSISFYLIRFDRKDYDLTLTPPFQGNSLVDAGYSYEYVSPESLNLPGVSVSNGRLAPGGPAYKAFVLNGGPNVTVAAAQQLLAYAKAGLPVVISGAIPNDIPGFDSTGTQKAQVQALMKQLANLPTVEVVANEAAVPAALAALGVHPAASFYEPPASDIYTIRREAPGASYFYLFNAGNTTASNLTLILRPESTPAAGTPFVLDAWTGAVAPVALWTSGTKGVISIPRVSLAPAQTALFAISRTATFESFATPRAHLSTLDAAASAIYAADGKTIEVRAPHDGSFAYTLSTGVRGTATVALEGEATHTLSGWTLQIVSWEAPQDLSTIDSVRVTQPIVDLTGGLVPWNTLPGQANTSGVGTYNTTFAWAHAANGTVGAQLDFGSVFHTVKAWVNGVQIPTADPTAPVVDISAYLVRGTNSLRVEAASTLLNAINSVAGVESLGALRTQTGIIGPNQAYGLVDPVRLVPFGRAIISL